MAGVLLQRGGCRPRTAGHGSFMQVIDPCEPSPDMPVLSLSKGAGLGGAEKPRMDFFSIAPIPQPSHCPNAASPLALARSNTVACALA